jgi:hypothetical protein
MRGMRPQPPGSLPLHRVVILPARARTAASTDDQAVRDAVSAICFRTGESETAAGRGSLLATARSPVTVDPYRITEADIDELVGWLGLTDAPPPTGG